MSEEIVSALQRELSAPSRGEVILRILEKLSFFEIGGSLIAAAAQKVELTRSDGEIHSFSALLPSSSLTYLFMCIVYPGTLRDGGNAAREDLFRNPFGNRTEISGVLQLTIFAGDNPLSLAFAWLPSASVSDPDLGSVVIPWKLQAPEVERAEAQPGGAEIVALAEATRRLTEAMHELLLIWPDEEGPVQKLGLPEAREELVTSIQTFNSAAKRCGLAHRMPLSVYDETWLPHNIENALQFGSVAATVRAELARTRGSAAAGLFTRTLATPLDEGRSAELARLAEEYDVTAPSTPEIEPANPASGVDVFICYSWADKTRGARDVYEFVQRHGLSAWFDEERRLQTASLDGDIAAAISSAQTVIVCFSQEMITGGGYVLRELLFALSAAPQRLIVARLDKSAVPATLAGVATVDWFRRGGGDELLQRLTAPPQSLPGQPATSLRVSSDALLNALLALVRPLSQPTTRFDARHRDASVDCRASLMTATLDVYRYREAQNWKGVAAAVDALRAKGHWLALNDPQLCLDMTIALPLVRLRRALFETELNLANSDGYAAHNRAAFELLEDLLAFDLDVLRPAPELGWLVDDSMVLVRDCLDAFAVAEEWFRGWSAEMLADMCGVPREPAMTAAARIAQKTADLADRMLALRLLEDNGQSDAPAQSWTNIWSSFRTSMLEKLHAEETSPAAIYFRALSTIFDDDLVARAAVRLADGTFESRRHNGQWREEVVQSKGAVRIRFVFRSYITNGPKTAAFNLVRGTVESDLADPAGLSDVTILLTAFVIPPTKDGEWKFEVFFNVLPHTADGTAPDALALRSAFLMSQMLSEEELARLTQEAPRMFYEEV